MIAQSHMYDYWSQIRRYRMFLLITSTLLRSLTPRNSSLCILKVSILFRSNRHNLLKLRPATYLKKLKRIRPTAFIITCKLKSTDKILNAQMSTATSMMIDILKLAITKYHSTICSKKLEWSISLRTYLTLTISSIDRLIWMPEKKSCTTSIQDQRFHSSLNVSLETLEKNWYRPYQTQWRLLKKITSILQVWQFYLPYWFFNRLSSNWVFRYDSFIEIRYFFHKRYQIWN